MRPRSRLRTASRLHDQIDECLDRPNLGRGLRRPRRRHPGAPGRAEDLPRWAVAGASGTRVQPDGPCSRRTSRWTTSSPRDGPRRHRRYVRFHDLQHTTATLLLEDGVSFVTVMARAVASRVTDAPRCGSASLPADTPLRRKTNAPTTRRRSGRHAGCGGRAKATSRTPPRPSSRWN